MSVIHHSHQAKFSAVSVGLLASEWLASSRHRFGETRTRVHAVFDRSFYLDVSTPGAFGGGEVDLLCFGTNELQPGALNLLANETFRSTITRFSAGTQVTYRDNTFFFADGLRFDVSDENRYEPATVEPMVLSDLKFLPFDAHLTRLPPGLSALIFRERANHCISSFREFLTASLAGESQPVSKDMIQLIGLGSGLTPAGDDFIAGVLLLLRALGYEDVCATLRDELVVPHLKRTNRISAAHLTAAARGYGSAPAHEFVNNVVTQNRAGISNAVNKLSTVGATSGRDALAGMCTVLECLPFYTSTINPNRRLAS